jgi:excisionase family DNA binding protein
MFVPPTRWTIADICALIGASSSTPHAWIADGKLRATKNEAGAWIVELADLQRLLRGRPGNARPLKSPEAIEWGAVPHSMSTTKAARLLGISPSWIAIQIRLGELKAEKLAGRYRVKRAELRRFAEERQARAEGRAA